MINDIQKYESMKPGTLIKEALAERLLSQKEFAEAIGVRPSHISEVINGKRKVTLPFARKIEETLGIAAAHLVSLQTALDIVNGGGENKDSEEIKATALLQDLDRIINIKALMKGARLIKPTSVNKATFLSAKYGITSAEEIESSIQQLEASCFRRSAKTGLDMRMITTWVVKAQAEAITHKPVGAFSLTSENEVCEQIVKLLHNNNKETNIQDFLSRYGIGFCEVSKLEHASIDGYSFMSDSIPYIVVTGRYDRIDNFAFTVMHELGHIYLSHTKEGYNNINLDLRSFNDDDVLSNPKEEAADRFASEWLIPDSIWRFVPPVRVLNPFAIQKKYTTWAKSKGLNPWIVLGRLSHETGIYKFKSDSNREVKIKKGGAPMI